MNNLIKFLKDFLLEYLIVTLWCLLGLILTVGASIAGILFLFLLDYISKDPNWLFNVLVTIGGITLYNVINKKYQRKEEKKINGIL